MLNERGCFTLTAERPIPTKTFEGGESKIELRAGCGDVDNAVWICDSDVSFVWGCLLISCAHSEVGVYKEIVVKRLT